MLPLVRPGPPTSVWSVGFLCQHPHSQRHRLRSGWSASRACRPRRWRGPWPARERCRRHGAATCVSVTGMQPRSASGLSRRAHGHQPQRCLWRRM